MQLLSRAMFLKLPEGTPFIDRSHLKESGYILALKGKTLDEHSFTKSEVLVFRQAHNPMASFPEELKNRLPGDLRQFVTNRSPTADLLELRGDRPDDSEDTHFLVFTDVGAEQAIKLMAEVSQHASSREYLTAVDKFIIQQLVAVVDNKLLDA